MSKITVAIRDKPSRNSSEYDITDTTINMRKEKKKYTYDIVLDDKTSNDDIFETIGKQVLSTAAQYNTCVFCYGNTGTGKTHTIDGLVERTLALLNGNEYSMTYYQIYAEKIFDMLNKQVVPLRIREKVNTGVFIEGLVRVEARFDYYKEAQAHRFTAKTNQNASSSRSHTVLTIYADGTVMNFIDLAGSERINESGVKGAQLKEAIAINQSLTTFNRVVTMLSKPHKREVIPYRESVLTRVLTQSLTGNSKTYLIATISPDSSLHLTEQTLSFANRIKRIKTKAKAKAKPTKVKASALLSEIDKLKAQLAQRQPVQQQLSREQVIKLNLITRDHLLQLLNN